LPITLDRILGDADEIGHFGDMADAIEEADTMEAIEEAAAMKKAAEKKLKQMRKKRNKNKRGSRVQTHSGTKRKS
jgi:hypothetical protein